MDEIRLVVSDLDGCLLGEGSRLPAQFPEALTAMQNRQVIFAAASGRSMPGVASVFGNLWEKMIMITDNGACLWRGRERLWADTIPRSEWYPVVTRARAIPGTVVIACGYSEAYIEHPETMDERTVRELRKYYPAWESANLDEMMGDMVKIAVMYLGDIEHVVYPVLRELETDILSVRVTAPTWMDIFDPRVSNGTGLARVHELLSVRPEETVVFGDYLNDRPMAEHAAKSFAPSNAHPQVQRAFSEVIGPNTEDSVVRKILSLMVSQGEC
ncbi:MAG: HAD family phosphatase [Clostridia bacterium]|nr:HAD family phosphatase [Clostridia bacterium]